jgi:carboxypeptidase PM20D1
VIDDPRITITPTVSSPPSPVSDANSPSYALLARTIRQVFPNVAVAPGMDLGGSDAKYYVGVSEQVYRFWPYFMTDADTKRLHGADERIQVENYLRSIQFYAQIIRNAD